MEMEDFEARWKEESLNFVEEEFYETIRAPKWIDFTLPHNAHEEDDNAWFCIQAGCDQKHGTSRHSFLLKLQTTRSNSCKTKLLQMEGKSRLRPGKTTPLSAPTLKGKDKMPEKPKLVFMSASKNRQKHCQENKDPNATNIGIFKLKMEISDATSDICSTPLSQKLKAPGAFYTPQVKKKPSVRPEPFRSIPLSSKGLNPRASKTPRSKAASVRSITFQTPNKSVNKTPSKDVSGVTKHCNDKKQGHFCSSSRCTTNDEKCYYFSPAKVTPKKHFARIHNTPSSSRTREKKGPSSNKKALFSETDKEQENMALSNAENMDMPTVQFETCTGSDRDGALYQEGKDAASVPANIGICGSNVIKSETELDIEGEGKTTGHGNIHEDGKCIKNSLSTNHEQTGNNEEKPTDSGCDVKEANLRKPTRPECGMKQQFPAQLAHEISSQGWPYGVNDRNSRKESMSYLKEESTLAQDEIDVQDKNRTRLQQFETTPEEKELILQNYADSQSEVTYLGDDCPSKVDVKTDCINLVERENKGVTDLDDENEQGRELSSFSCESEYKGSNTEEKGSSRDLTDTLDVESDDRKPQETASEVMMVSPPDNKRDGVRIGISSEEEYHLQNVSDGKDEISCLENGKNYSDKDLERRTKEVLMESAAENRGAREDASIKVLFASKSESKERNMEGETSTDLKSDIDILSDNTLIDETRANETLMYLDDENERAIQETASEIKISPETGSECALAGERADSFGKNIQTSKKIEDPVACGLESAIKSTEMEAGDVVKVGPTESENKISQKDTTDSNEYLQVSFNDKIRNGKEENRVSLQKINTVAGNEGLSQPDSTSHDSPYIAQVLYDDTNTSIEVAYISELPNYEEIRKKRRSNLMNCLKVEELCMHEASPGIVDHMTSPSKQGCVVNDMSALHTRKPKRTKHTLPKPFKLRTEERGALKEEALSKKNLQNSPCCPHYSMPNKKEKKKEPSKLGKASGVAQVNLHQEKPTCMPRHIPVKVKMLEERGDKENDISHQQHQDPHEHEHETQPPSSRCKKRVPYFGQPFKPHRSTKKPTIPREPKFHSLHSKKDCTLHECDN